MEIQKQNNQLANTSELLKQIAQVNLLTAFPINDLYLEQWVKTIQELAPDLTPERLKSLIDKMKCGILDYDHRKGVQNILLAHRPARTFTGIDPN